MDNPRRLPLLLASAVLAAAGHLPAQAEEPAATKQLPVAVRALGIEINELVSDQQAHTVRGSGLSIETDGVVVEVVGVGQFGTGQLALAGVAGGQTVTLAADPSGFHFDTDRPVIIGDQSQFQGMIATGTGVFNGYLSFQGDTSTLTIVALPGAFVADFR